MRKLPGPFEENLAAKRYGELTQKWAQEWCEVNWWKRRGKCLHCSQKLNLWLLEWPMRE